MCHASAASDQVDDDVLVEGGPPLRRHPAHVHDGLGVVGVHVEDGRIDDPGHVGGVGGGAGHSRVCCEADLRANAYIVLETKPL